MEHSLGTALERGLGSPLFLAQKRSSPSSLSENVLCSKKPFRNENVIYLNSDEEDVPPSPPHRSYMGIGSGSTLALPVEPSTLAPLRSILNLPVTTAAPSENSATSDVTNLNYSISNKYWVIKKKPLDLSKMFIVKTLGEGGSALVYEVEYPTGPLALKVTNQYNNKQWENECSTLDRLLGVQNIVQLVDVIENLNISSLKKNALSVEDTPARALVLEYYPRGDLVSNGCEVILFQLTCRN